MDHSLQCPLDLQLASLWAMEREATNLPLALRRFAGEFGVDRPTTAMRMAVNGILNSYAVLFEKKDPPIAVERLCEVCSAELTGQRPKGRASNVYSVDRYQPRIGHTGKLYFRNSRVSIKIPGDVDYATARISVAHELGHLLIHRRGNTYDEATVRLSSSDEEEALAEYAARLLLIPPGLWSSVSPSENLAVLALSLSSLTKVTLHAVVARTGDPDIPVTGVRAAILWRINRTIPASRPVSARLTPQWHLCPGAFVPVGKCKAREGSLVAALASEDSPAAGSSLEEVEIGSFSGTFRVDGFSWGSVQEGTRLVLSVFRDECSGNRVENTV